MMPRALRPFLAIPRRGYARTAAAAFRHLGLHSAHDDLRVGLWVAFLWGTPGEIADWVRRGASPDMPFPTHFGSVANEVHDGRTILHVAARHRDRVTGSGSLDGYGALLANSRLLDRADRDGLTVLHHALASGCPERLALTLAHDPDTTCQTRDGADAETLAARDPALLAVLLRHEDRLAALRVFGPTADETPGRLARLVTLLYMRAVAEGVRDPAGRTAVERAMAVGDPALFDVVAAAATRCAPASPEGIVILRSAPPRLPANGMRAQRVPSRATPPRRP
jgi:hypothetical protein